MENQLKSTRYIFLIKGIIMIILALVAFNSPGGVLLAFSFYIGIGLLVTGFIMLYQGLELRKKDSNWGWSVFEGLLDFFLGYILITNPLITTTVLPFIIGFWAVFYGVLLIINSFSVAGNRLMKILTGVLMLIIGNVIMHNPIFAGLTLVIWVGVMLLVAGVFNIIASFRLKSIGL